MNKLNLKDLQSDKPDIKYHCAKRAIALSAKNPKALYPQLDTFVKMLDGDNNVLRWTALIVIGNLSSADTKNKITKLVPRLIVLTQGPSMITANNAIQALGKIAAAKPQFKIRIFKALLAVEKATYYNKGEISPECRNIALGKVIDVLAGFRNDISANKTIVHFVRRQTKNRRTAVKKRAEGLSHVLL